MKSRKRVVVFRVTDEEYEALKGACSKKGGRNLSEFTRAELLDACQSESLGGIIQKRFSQVDRKLDELRDSVDQISERLEGGPQPPLDKPENGKDSL